MASSVNLIALSFTIILLFTYLNAADSIPLAEFDSILSLLRARGYTLFPNAISTSDLQIHLLSVSPNASFTFFAPTDSSLFALDMTLTASSYTNTLSYHVVPRRLSFSDLRSLPSGASLPTLLPSRILRVTRRRRTPQHSDIFVGGIEVVLPELYRGQRVVVHGLGGIVTLRSPIDIVYSSDSPSPSPSVHSSGFGRLPTRRDRGIARNSTTKSQIHRTSPVAPTAPRTYPAKGEVVPPVSPPTEVTGAYSQSPAPSPGNERGDMPPDSSNRSPESSPESSPVSSSSPIVDEVRTSLPEMSERHKEEEEEGEEAVEKRAFAQHTTPFVYVPPDDVRVEDSVEKSWPLDWLAI